MSPISLLVCWMALQAGAESSERTREQEVARALAPVLEPEEGETRFPALVIGLWKEGKRHFFRFGDLESEGEPETVLFPVASLTKPVTALLLARSVVEGERELDGPAVLCEEMPSLCPRGRAITWRQLATHTAGFPMVVNNRDDASSDYDETRWQQFLDQLVLSAEPSFSYSTVGFTLLGRSLAEEHGKSYPEWATHQVLGPLGMKDACFEVGEESLGRLEAGHGRDGKRLRSETITPRFFAPSGGLVATAEDLLTFLEAHLRPTAEWQAAVDLVLQPYAEIPSFPMSVAGLGWQYLTVSGVHWHAGHGSGHHTFMALHQENNTAIVILTNAATVPWDTRLATACFGLLE